MRARIGARMATVSETDLAALLQRMMEARDVGVRELSRATGIAPATISGMRNGQQDIVAKKLSAIADALRYTVQFVAMPTDDRPVTLSEAQRRFLAAAHRAAPTLADADLEPLTLALEYHERRRG